MYKMTVGNVSNKVDIMEAQIIKEKEIMMFL